MDDGLVDQLFQSAQFKILLREEILKVKVDDARRESGMASELINEIADMINQITMFKVRQILNQELAGLIHQSAEMRSQLDILKNSMLEFMSKTHIELQKRKSNPQKVIDEFDLLEGDSTKPRAEKTSHLSVQLLKLRQDVDSIRATTQRISNSSFLKMLHQNNEAMNKKIEQRYGRLARELQDVSEKSMIQERSFEKTTSSLIDSRYEALESQVGSQSENMRDLVDRQKLFEEALCDKYQTSLKSLWNIVTMTQNEVIEFKKEYDQSRMIPAIVSPKAQKRSFIDNLFK